MPDSSSADLRAAQQLHDEVDAAGGRITIAADTLLALFAAERLTSPDAARIRRALEAQSLVADPSPEALGRSDRVTIATAGLPRRRRDDSDGDRADLGSDADPVAPAEAIAADAAALPTGLLRAGVVAPGASATVIGLASWWGYGLLFALLTAAGWWLVPRLRVRLARVFLPSVSWVGLRAVVVGLAPMLLVIALVGLLIVAPVSANRRARADERQARTLVAQAEDAISGGDLPRADRLLDRAQDRSSDVAGYAQTRRRADDIRRKREQERENADRYAEAQTLRKHGHYGEAIDLLVDLGNYRDARMLSRAYASDGARRFADRAQNALADGDHARALRLAEQSIELRSTRAGRAARADARAARDRARAQARARRLAREQAARERAQARRLQRERARAAARAEAAARADAQRAADAAAAAGEYDDGGDESGNWCGASRDGDGDGIWCEGE